MCVCEAVSSGVVRRDFTKKVTSEQRPKGRGVGHMAVCGHSECKGPEVGGCLECLWERTQGHKAVAEEGRGKTGGRGRAEGKRARLYRPLFRLRLSL